MTVQSQSLRAKAAMGGRWTATSAIASVLLQIAQFAILGRLLGPSEFGLMAMMMIVLGLTNAISDFGLGNYLVQKENLSRKTLTIFLVIISGMSTLVAVLVALSSNLIADFYRAPKLVELLPWLSIPIVVFSINQMLMSVLQRFFAFKQIAIGEIISLVLTLASTTMLALSGYGIWSLVIGQIVACSTRLLVFAFSFAILVKQLPKDDQSRLPKARSFIFFQTGERLVNYFGSNLDKVIIGRLLGDVGLGLYSAAYQLMIRPVAVLNPIFTRVTLPLLVSIRGDDARLAEGYLQTIRTIAFLSFPIYLVMAVGAPAIILVLVGEKWIGAAPILYVLSFYGLFCSIGNPIGTLVLAKTKPELTFYFNLFSLLIYTPAFWIGSHYSALGVALALLISSLSILYPLEFYLRHKLVGMSVAHYFHAMRHLFMAVGIPVFLHAIIYLPEMEPSSVFSQSIMAILAVTFFFGYLSIFDRSLTISMKNLIFKGN